MTFFNKKEEVIDIKLTRYGKQKLSKGELKPAYYAFFDDDILYDTEYAGETENQSTTEVRIQTETPSLRTQPTHEGAELTARTIEDFQATGDKHYSLAYPLGTSALTSDFRPSWDLKFLKGELSSSVNYITGSHQNMLIPQLDVEVKYKTIVRDINDELGDLSSQTDGDVFRADRTMLSSKLFPDGTYLQVVQDPVLLDIFEDNTEFELDNVSIEFYEIERVDMSGSIQVPDAATSDKTKKIVLKPMKFVQKFNNIKNDLLVPEEDIGPNNVNLDPNYIEYYLDILVDREIPEQEICEGIQTLKSKNIEIDDFLQDYDCEDVPVSQLDIYDSNILEENEPDCEETENCP